MAKTMTMTMTMTMAKGLPHSSRRTAVTFRVTYPRRATARKHLRRVPPIIQPVADVSAFRWNDDNKLFHLGWFPYSRQRYPPRVRRLDSASRPNRPSPA